MPEKRADVLLNTMLFIELYTLNRAWDGLTDDELFWEPLPGSWGVRRRVDCRTPNPFGDGEWIADFDGDLAWAAAEGRAIEPLTTIGWLLWHVGSLPRRLTELDLFGGAHPVASGWSSPYITSHPVFSTADEAVTTMREGWRALDTALRAATDEQLEIQAPMYGYGDEPGFNLAGAQVVGAALNEISHHGTQICMLRDLYRASGGVSLMSTSP